MLIGYTIIELYGKKPDILHLSYGLKIVSLLFNKDDFSIK